MKSSIIRFAKRSVAAGIAALAMTSGAQAASVLLYDDFTFATATWAQALAGLGLNVTTVSNDAAFNTAVTGVFDLVVVQFDDVGHSINLAGYLGAGGKAIYSNWLATDDALFGLTATDENKGNLAVTSAALSAGLSTATQTLVNPTYGIFSRSFSGGTSLGSLGNGAGIVSTNGGNAIVNGFLGETFALSADEIKLYQNEVNNLLTLTPAVPEPQTYALMLAGLAAMGFVAKRRTA